MTIKAILHDGIIQPIEPLPPGWAEGQELLVEEPQADRARAAAEISEWAQELEIAAAKIPAEEHERFLRALDEIEQESKEAAPCVSSGQEV